jgi:hypothetical protein
VVGEHAVDAVPQQPPALIELAKNLAARGRPDEAARAAARAVERANLAESALKGQLEVALLCHRNELISSAAGAYLEARPEAGAYVVAAEAYQSIGDAARSDAAIALGAKEHPEDSSLVLAGARLRLGRGDLAGVRALLRRSGDGTFSLRDRQEAEELMAQVADRAGDSDAAVMARARARLLARQRQQANQLEYGGHP